MTAPVSAPPAASQITIALLDLVDGARTFHLWGLLGWQDIRRRYRRSVIGPFWLTISMGALVAMLSILYGRLLRIDIADYAPYVALGFVIWTLVSNLLTDGCSVFIRAENIIKQVDMPLSVHLYRMVWCNFLIFCHNAAIFVVVAAIFSIWPGWVGLLVIPGLVLLCLNGLWMGLLFGLVSARFRDVPPIIASILRIVFFMTPIIWMPELLPDRAVLLMFNPFYHLLDVVRGPLLGQVPGLVSWFTVMGIMVFGSLLTFTLFCRYRRHVVYWL